MFSKTTGKPKIEDLKEQEEQEKTQYFLEELRIFFLEQRDLSEKEKTKNYTVYNECLKKMGKGAELIYKSVDKQHILYVKNVPLNSEAATREISKMLESLVKKQKNSPKPGIFTQFVNWATQTSFKINASNLTAFLKLVAEGEQDKAEALLKNNPALALVPGDVTDLSKRTFKSITAFQYAVWALDWHMWTMIRKHIGDEAAREQVKGFETGSWVSEHGVHAQHLLEKLSNALQTSINLLPFSLDSLSDSKQMADIPQDAFEPAAHEAALKVFVQQVGDAQLLLPTHAINEYCHPTRSFKPVPNFEEVVIFPRTRTIGEEDWFTVSVNGGKLGDKFAFLRGDEKKNVLGFGSEFFPKDYNQPIGNFIIMTATTGFLELSIRMNWISSMPVDRDCIRVLTSTRITQRERLITELRHVNIHKKSLFLSAPQPAVNVSSMPENTSRVVSPAVLPALKVNLLKQENPPTSAMLSQFQDFTKPSPQKNTGDAKELGEFLRLVSEGEQDKVETMLKSNLALALVPGDVTDLSKRTFTNITGFQYAVWALDWHMWTMIQKYLPIDEAKKQAREFETGAWVKQHGVNAQHLLDNLTKALQVTIDLYNAKKHFESSRALVQQVGEAQLLLPAHVINEYCHPRRPFYPLPNFKDELVLPRTRNIRHEGEWFSAKYCGDTLAKKFAVVRAQARGGSVSVSGVAADAMEQAPCEYLVRDCDSVRALSGTRTAQREKLINELKPQSIQKTAVR